MRLETGDGETTLVSDIVDQAQLQGVLPRLTDFGLVLLRMSQVQSPARSSQDITKASSRNGRAWPPPSPPCAAISSCCGFESHPAHQQLAAVAV